MKKSVKVRTPSSTANLGPGFDVFGLALDAFYDEVTVSRIEKGIVITTQDDIPVKIDQNTAGLVAKAMKKKFKISGGIEIKIKKNIPPGFGLGSSAASAAACAVGINKLYNLKLSPNELVSYAGIGEKASDAAVKMVEIKHLRTMKDEAGKDVSVVDWSEVKGVDNAISQAEADLVNAEARVTELKADIAEYKKIKG